MTELKIKTGDYALSFEQLGNLISEFYGKALTGNDNSGEIIFGFDEEMNVPRAIAALESYPIDGNYDWKMKD
jgi:hypothetical protein